MRKRRFRPSPHHPHADEEQPRSPHPASRYARGAPRPARARSMGVPAADAAGSRTSASTTSATTSRRGSGARGRASTQSRSCSGIRRSRWRRGTRTSTTRGSAMRSAGSCRRARPGRTSRARRSCSSRDVVGRTLAADHSKRVSANRAGVSAAGRSRSPESQAPMSPRGRWCGRDRAQASDAVLRRNRAKSRRSARHLRRQRRFARRHRRLRRAPRRRRRPRGMEQSTSRRDDAVRFRETDCARICVLGSLRCAVSGEVETMNRELACVWARAEDQPCDHRALGCATEAARVMPSDAREQVGHVGEGR